MGMYSGLEAGSAALQMDNVLQSREDRYNAFRTKALKDRFGDQVTNPSGYHPTEFKVLIRPDEAPEKIGSIYVPTEKQEKDKFGTTEGVIVEASHLAFNYADEAQWGGAKPKAGDRVVFTKHAGVRVKGDDGVDYLLVTDREILSFRAGK